MPKRQIYLTGFMGTGKSTILNCLHQLCGLQKIEMDEQIVQEQGMSIPDIFAQKGEETFRNLETELVKRISHMDNIVVSCGGGTVMRQCNVEEMKKNGTIVLLTATPQTVYERVKAVSYTHLAEKANKVRQKPLRVILNGLGKDAAQIISCLLYTSRCV